MAHAHTSSSQDFQKRQQAQSTTALRSLSRSKLTNSTGRQVLKISASLQNVTQLETTRYYPQRPNSFECLDTCQVEPPVKEPFTIRNYNGKTVRDVLIDTHDMINEPGGFILNMAQHGQHSNSNEINIHLCIKEKMPSSTDSFTGIVSPGTISTTDDYARGVFKAVTLSRQLEGLTAILEINDKDDRYEQKVFDESPPYFLQQIIQTYPKTLTKFHVEMPGISPVYLPEWKFLLEQQICLKILICNFGVVLWTFYEDCIARNSASLEKVVLRRVQTYDIVNATYYPLDWGMFSECTNLTYLKVTCGFKRNLAFTMPQPPWSVFIHDNLEDLPIQDTFAELHLGKIWIDPYLLKTFCNDRPFLRVCAPCNDLEYYDGDSNEDVGQQGETEMRLLSVSTFNLQAEFTEKGQSSEHSQIRSQQQRQLAYIVLTLFIVILLSLAFLFIIIYFRHLRASARKKAEKT